jgi:RNA polymerase sigma-70 factor (ECF subfamily)
MLLASIEAPLRRYLSRLVRPEDVDDVLQSVLILIFRKLLWLEDPALLHPWAFRIASRAAFRWLKRENRRPEEALDEGALEEIRASDERPADELLSELHLLAMSPASRAVVVLHFQEDLPLAEVAKILEIPLGTVKSRLAYGLAALRRQLGGTRRP